MIFIDFFHQPKFLFLHFWHFFLVSFFLFVQFHDSLSLFCIYSWQFVFPKLHILLLCSLWFLINFSLFLLLTCEEISFHLSDSAVVFVWLHFELSGVIEFDKIDCFLDILELFLVCESDLLIASSELVDSLYFFWIIFKFLDRRWVTHWLIWLTYTFFWMASLVSCLFFFTLSFSFWSCCRNI